MEPAHPDRVPSGRCHYAIAAVGSGSLAADVSGYVIFPPVHLLGSLTSGIYEQLGDTPWESTVYLGLAKSC